ncbi:unnamed protein product, partial [Iphiclides podalirius]
MMATEGKPASVANEGRAALFIEIPANSTKYGRGAIKAASARTRAIWHGRDVTERRHLHFFVPTAGLRGPLRNDDRNYCENRIALRLSTY